MLAQRIHTLLEKVQAQDLLRKKRQYYALYGLVPLNKVDTKAMVGDTKDFKLETGAQAVDVLIGMVGGSFTVTSRTVKVTK